MMNSSYVKLCLFFLCCRLFFSNSVIRSDAYIIFNELMMISGHLQHCKALKKKSNCEENSTNHANSILKNKKQLAKSSLIIAYYLWRLICKIPSYYLFLGLVLLVSHSLFLARSFTHVFPFPHQIRQLVGGISLLRVTLIFAENEAFITF